MREKGLGLYDITRDGFPLPDMARDLAHLRDEVLHRRGMVVIRGFPVDDLCEDDLGVMYWGVGTHFGEAQSQSVMGDRLGRVTSRADLDRNERAYRNRQPLLPHTDRTDVVAMLCIRPARSGGVSGYVNGLAVHNVIAEEHPEFLPVLYRGFSQHRFGEERSGEAPISAWKPIFSVCEGVPTAQYTREYYDMAVEELGTGYTDEERRALDFMDEVTLRPNMKLDILHQPGEASFINNYVVMHSRTTFVDRDDPARARLLLRLWLRIPDGRPLVDALRFDLDRTGVAYQSERNSAYFTRWKRTQAS